MSGTNREQDYPFSFKTVSTFNQVACNYKAYFQMFPPEELLRHKNLHTTIIFLFDAGVASANRVISKVGIGNEFPLLITSKPATYKEFDVNAAADANRRLELSLDLSPLVIPNQANWVYVEFPAALSGNTNIGSFKLWKIDELFTTKGIR